MAPLLLEAPGRLPGWYPVLWIAAIGALALGRGARRAFLRTAFVAACGAVTLVWSSSVRQRVQLAERDVETPVEFLALAKEIARWHHEKWDGSGYPDGLAGDAIPVSARLMAVADVFDALTTRRVYKPPMEFPEARDIIMAGRGSHFDPDVADAFASIFEEFRTIAKHYADAD